MGRSSTLPIFHTSTLFTSRRLVFLNGFEEEVVFLAFLHEDVFSLKEQVGGGGGVDVGDFFFVDGEAALLGEFAELAFGGEYGGAVGEEVGDFCLAAVDFIEAYFVLGHAGKHGEEGGLVDAVKDFGGVVC